MANRGPIEMIVCLITIIKTAPPHEYIIIYSAQILTGWEFSNDLLDFIIKVVQQNSKPLRRETTVDYEKKEEENFYN